MDKVIKPFLIIIFFISPLTAFVPVLIEMYNGKKYAYWLFIVFWAMVAYLYPPQGDLYRYYHFYDYYKDVNYTDVFNYISDVVWYSILWILAHFKIPFSFSQSILSFCYSISLFFILSKLSKYHCKNSSLFYLFISSFFSIPFWSLIGARFNMAISMYMLFLFYYFIDRKRLLFIIFSILSVLSHFSFIIFILLTLVADYYVKFINKYTVLIVSISLYLAAYSIGIYMENIGYEKAVYIVNKSDWLSNASPLLVFFYKYLLAIPFWVLVIYFITKLKSNKDKLCRISLLFLGISFALIEYPDMVGRFYSVFSVLVLLVLYKSNLLSYKDFNWSKILIIASIMVFFFSSVINYRAIGIMKLNLLAKPIPVLLEHEYSYNWIEDHFIDGDLINTNL